MGKIWTFGDSFTASFNPKSGWSDTYTKWKGYQPKVFGEFMSDELGLELINLGKSGTSNYCILDSISSNIGKIRPGDIVIIGWTSCVRFRIVNSYDRWTPILPSFYEYIDNTGDIKEDSLIEILVNREHKLYEQEVNSWMSLINKSLLDCKVIQWKHSNDGVRAHKVMGKENITMETNGEIVDGHYSENGHYELSLEFMQMLEKKTYKNLI